MHILYNHWPTGLFLLGLSHFAMLSIHPQELPQLYNFSYRPLSYPPSSQMPFITGNCSGLCGVSPSDHSKMHHVSHDHQRSHSQHQQLQQDTSVAQALEIARESPDGASNSTISSILERALSQLWSKVEAQPDSYVLTRDEFAVFNYFQHRFRDNQTARAARCRYWDNMSA